MRAAFLNNFLECFLSTFVNLSQLKEHEYLNIASLVENLMAPVNMKKLNLINGQLVDAFFKASCAFVISCFKAEKTCMDSFESKKYLESYEKILISWTSITSCIELSEAQENLILKSYSQTILSGFVESRLNTASIDENIQLSSDINDEESHDENEDSSEDDFHCYKEVLYSIGEFSKYSLDYSLPMLSK